MKTPKDKIGMEDIQFRVYFIKDYSSSESCVVLKISHCLTDGVGVLMLAAAIQDTFDPK
jgi:hypothetical protein